MMHRSIHVLVESLKELTLTLIILVHVMCIQSNNRHTGRQVDHDSQTDQSG